MPSYAFVDSIGSSPTVLLDLNDRSPFGVIASGVDTSPPPKRFSTSSSTSRDGDTVAQSSYADRQLTIPLRVEIGTTPEQQVEAIQKLGRLLDQPQWLMWQHEGQMEPVFFRTRQGDYRVAEDVASTDKTRRSVTVTVAAEPFAYGLPVTGTATVNNDPSAPTNPMSFVLSDVQGDVATPLHLSWSAPWLSSRAMVSSYAADSVAGAVARVDIPATSAPAATGTYSIADATDSAMISGKRRRVTNSGATGSQVVWSGSVASKPGDYRVFVRVKTGVGSTASWRFMIAGLSVLTSIVAPVPTWVDLGVTRLPAGYPPSSKLYARPAVNSPLTLTAATTTAGSGMDFDEILFVPAGLDDATDSRLGFIQDDDSSWVKPIQIDADSDIAFTAGDGIYDVLTVNGGLPRLVPDRQNLLVFVFSVFRPLWASEDSKATTVTVTWSYYPRYLYTRPATT